MCKDKFDEQKVQWLPEKDSSITKEIGGENKLLANICLISHVDKVRFALADLKNIGKTSDMQKANPNSLNMSLTKDMKWKQ